MVDTKTLNSLIKNKGIRKDAIAMQLGITKQSLSNKINNKTEFKMSEVSEIRVILGIANDEIVPIFFASRLDCESTSVGRGMNA